MNTPATQTESSTTLAELATTWPAASRIFHHHRLDFCCGGHRSFEVACAERGIDAKALLAEITADGRTDDQKDWQHAPLDELVAFIVGHYHERLRMELPDLVALSSKVETRHTERDECPKGLTRHLSEVHAAVLDHLEKEEKVLFPMILAGMGKNASGPVRAMEHEHDDHAVNLRRIRALTHDLVAPDDACDSWRALYLRLSQLELELMEHIHLENNVLFPRALCE